VQLLLHGVAVPEKDLAADAAGEIEEDVGGADEHVGGDVENVAVGEGPSHRRLRNRYVRLGC
jgi:hypothetical protein